MARIFLGVGSNIDRERNIVAGLDALSALLGELQLSPVYDSSAVGFDGESFLNMVVAAETALPVGVLARRLREIEFAHGREPDATRFSSRRLDIDILTYGDLTRTTDGVELPRGEILENAFVLRPLADLAPAVLHPVAGRSYASLWQAFDEPSQRLRRIDFSGRGRPVSTALAEGEG